MAQEVGRRFVVFRLVAGTVAFYRIRDDSQGGWTNDPLNVTTWGTLAVAESIACSIQSCRFPVEIGELVVSLEGPGLGGSGEHRKDCPCRNCREWP